MLISLVIRTLNEARHLPSLLKMVQTQIVDGCDIEVVVIDSGSTDGTVEIARAHDARVTFIDKSEFSFGRSLNRGCAFARGDILVLISGHCIPVDTTWLQQLCQPLIDSTASYAYGRQIGNADTNYSEHRIFAKYFPPQSAIPQDGFFCNNANSAILRSAWEPHGFDEEITGLEDMELAKRLVAQGHKIAYVAQAPVYHLHDESWAQVRRRFEREALALQSIMPEVQLTRLDMLRYIASSVWMDWRSARAEPGLRVGLWPIMRYRVAQFRGAYAGNHEHRRISQAQKETYFYPAVTQKEASDDTNAAHHRLAADEGKQSASEGQKL